VVGSQVGNLLEELSGYPIAVGAQVGKPGEHSICLRVLDGGLRGKRLDGVLYCNRPNSLTLHPSNSETAFGNRDILATTVNVHHFGPLGDNGLVCNANRC
jgi:hypothetical protein